MEMIRLTQAELEHLLEECARRGAILMFEELALYNMEDAAKRLSISVPTLNRRIKEGKIVPKEGKLSGREIRRFLGRTD